RFLTTFVLIVNVHMDIAAVPYGCLAGWLGMLVWEIPFLIWRFRKNNLPDP
ncbi:MAG TPA: MATE family efflux transporter, partial [Lachnospiraceae bacterium]|nr:MATE family efflux transporter [Lachnospiraceae bacterium]